jgi:metallo-beta-lactamase family protein
MKAKVNVLNTLSGHGDYEDIEQWLKASDMLDKTQIYLVHGDPDALEGMRDHLSRTTRFSLDIAGYRHIETIE